MAHTTRLNYYLLPLLICLIVSCGTSDTVRVVEEGPRAAERDTVRADTTEQFMQLNIGLIDSVDNFDPLFARNISTKRVLSLIYDGLFTLDRSGEVEPAIANQYTVSDDSLTYTIIINRDLFYHDSPAFSSGIGTRIQASDIKWAFERTAHSNVPPEASRLLMNIDGYAEYYEEQRNLYDPDRRALAEVSGIVVENNQTIRFHLYEPDPDFLRKLASPYLFIYPREALQGRTNLKETPIGTAAYTFRERAADGTIILSKDDSDYNEARLTQPRINRINFISHDQESSQYRSFISNDLDWIPEAGPETVQLITSQNNELSDGYEEDNISSTKNGYRITEVFFNDSPRVNINWLRNRLATVEPDSIELPGEITIIDTLQQNDRVLDNPDPRYLVAFTHDIYARSLLTILQQKYLEPDSELRLVDIQVPVSRTALYTRISDNYHHPYLQTGNEPWLRLRSEIIGFHHRGILGINEQQVPWKLFVEEIRNRSDQEAP